MRVATATLVAVVLGGCGHARGERGAPESSAIGPSDDAETAGQESLGEIDRGSILQGGVTMQASSFVPMLAAQEKPAPSTPPAGRPRGRFVVSGSVSVITDDVVGVVAAIRTRTGELGGTVASESVNADP